MTKFYIIELIFPFVNFFFMYFFSGEIGRGDQILKINKKSLDGLTLTQAQEILWQAEQDSKTGVGQHGS